ncbi:MAG: hypothetical protein EOO30_13920 [Comamonadaceae bacterium]|nr:MAG: hypothetical protein EOO30_13920 [Comamonadaceae bacterium]
MNPVHAQTGSEAQGVLAGASLDASDAFLELARQPRYCPTGLLATFALLMAGHGRCVNTNVMLGDREYAMWQLACARALDDAELSQVTSRLFAYFDDPQHSATPMLGTA